ncbi:ATP-binding protein [Thermoclostridium caenicola]|uniref:4Fe-4S binding domain-containing protein n=1 Tax=Thermoclostridium caenicola TaxID=659425 RepID=A0A1M6HXC2_9FIRM|nr:4Fe-4S dicluster domain-containing protein [Thermoclostridium caenicola]SHJ26788.1 4Fe-4S binding domain-containing protein [Thermoclostridium caenicola]HOP72579.1 4Fe-4S dicluster domain-containing protein [Thermoclostridium caenicola]
MIRKIVKIDEDKCNGCGLCITACHEGALQLVNGKARLVSEAYCDGLGNCLPECPTGAITIEEREAAAFDEAAVLQNMAQKASSQAQDPVHHHAHTGGCPGSRAMFIRREAAESRPGVPANTEKPQSELRQWPCQIRLVPPNAPYFQDAHLLVAADCTAYAYANIHQDYMKNKITIIGCPKLDDEDYSEKLTDILSYNDIRSITVLRMEVPCCGGIVNAVKNALLNSGKMIPWQVVTIGTDGTILND